MTETIKAMLEDPESDNDEVNARIWYWLNDWSAVQTFSDFFEDRPACPGEYTTSLDAAMSIGAEELEGWIMDMSTLGQAWIQPFEALKTTKFEAINLPDMPRAICHARIQALEYVRGL